MLLTTWYQVPQHSFRGLAESQQPFPSSTLETQTKKLKYFTWPPVCLFHPYITVVLCHAGLGVQERKSHAPLCTQAGVITPAMLYRLPVEIFSQPEKTKRSQLVKMFLQSVFFPHHKFFPKAGVIIWYNGQSYANISLKNVCYFIVWHHYKYHNFFFKNSQAIHNLKQT